MSGFEMTCRQPQMEGGTRRLGPEGDSLRVSCRDPDRNFMCDFKRINQIFGMEITLGSQAYSSYASSVQNLF